jgi:Rps23 Pro-64 3,4-dihydroxylase Tpa1-like proline 4-hydroxylase
MNTVEQAKQQLKDVGYTSFNIKDYNENFYNFLLKYKCSQWENIQHKIKNLRFDSPGKAIKSEHSSYELAYEEGTELLKQYATTRGGMIQCWYYAEAFEILDTNKQDENFYDDFLNNVFDIVGHIYDIDSSTLTRHASQATYYPKGSFLTEHSDGAGTGRVCAVLIYLNESYEEKDGGYLVLDKTEKVLPHFGNVAIIDLQSFDVKHEVTEVVGGIGRYAFLTFIKTKENELVNF